MPTLDIRPRRGRDLHALLAPADVRRLGNGLTVCVVPHRRSPVVATAVVYRAGTRDEGDQEAGAAHFLEHMMFKGSAEFGPGEVDRETRALGGSNNAYTSHEITLYYFTFAADRWLRALDIEADRMAGLTLDPKEVASERQVILEELAMYDGEPWDALNKEVRQTYFRHHPYGKPVLGTRESLAGLDRRKLDDFHRRLYRPGGAVVMVVGDVDPDAAHVAVADRFEGFSRRLPKRPELAHDPGPGGPLRIQRRQGELARLLLALPSPPTTDPDHAALRLLLSILASGRASRLHRRLVDDDQLCVWVNADVPETLDPSCLGIAAELVPGAEPERAEVALLAELRRCRGVPPSAEEIDRAKQMIYADWLFGHERVEQQTFLLGTALTLHDLEQPFRYLEDLLNTGPDDLSRVAARYLDVEAGSVVGWSLPESGAAS
ncbi:MAG: pitrilysin family protein [Acidobacteriota bacterium]